LVSVILWVIAVVMYVITNN